MDSLPCPSLRPECAKGQGEEKLHRPILQTRGQLSTVGHTYEWRWECVLLDQFFDWQGKEMARADNSSLGGNSSLSVSPLPISEVTESSSLFLHQTPCSNQALPEVSVGKRHSINPSHGTGDSTNPGFVPFCRGKPSRLDGERGPEGGACPGRARTASKAQGPCGGTGR